MSVDDRKRPPPIPETINVNMNVNLNVGGALALTLVPPPVPLKAVFTATIGGFTVRGSSPMAYTLPDEMMVYVQVAYVDANGNPATVDGDTTWTSSNDDIAQVVPNPDDSTRAQVWGKSLGQAQITSSADADLGEGTKAILATLDINVVAGEAVSATITPSGEPEPIPVERSGQTGRRK
jgi:hypothetical protein